MIDYDKYKSVGKGFYFVDDIEQYGLQFEEVMQEMSFFQDICKRFCIDMEYLRSIVVRLGIPYRDMFMYTITKSPNVLALAKENGVYCEKRDTYKMNYREYRNVYVCQNEYISTKYSKIAMEIFKDKYSRLFNEPMFQNVVRKYPIDLKFDSNMTIDTFSSLNDSQVLDDLTLNDIAYLIFNPNGINDIKYESKFKFYYYGNDVMYLEMFDVNIHGNTYPISLAIPINAIVSKNWSLIEDYYVYNIIKPNANSKLGKDINNWFNGKQKDFPYWNSDIINQLKKYF